MANFTEFKKVVHEQFKAIAKNRLFKTDINKDDMWDTYLKSFPEGTNPIFRERTEHDCQHCRQFIRAAGNTVGIVNNELVSIWDVEIGGFYQVVADAMASLVKSRPVIDSFLSTEKRIGVDLNHQHLDDKVITWNHLYYKLPAKFVTLGSSIGSSLSERRSSKEVFYRGLTEISISAIEIVLELIEQNSLYRGEEHKIVVNRFLSVKQQFDRLDTDEHKHNYCWTNSAQYKNIARIRNSVIGTLLVDISDGMELDAAVRLFETKVAPTNYKRPTAIVTKSMIDNAQKKVIDLDIESALKRRYAVTDDITIPNVLFADRTVKQSLGVFDEIKKEASVNIKQLEKVEKVDITTFIESILPKVNSIELMVENKHTNNFMSLIAPCDSDAASILKWGNNFSWAYNGAVADSIKERVKKAGGNVTGVLRCSLAWFNYDDLDLHVKETTQFGRHIYFPNKGVRHQSSGILDVDMNVSDNDSREAVENITWSDKSKMKEGIYEVFVHNYTQRETDDVGFTVEIEFDNVIHTLQYNKRVVGNVPVARFKFSRKDGIKFISSLPATQMSKEVWGLSTQQFHKVSMIMNSPNHWDGNKTGNKHYFFILEDCINDAKARGFFNEFLRSDLTEHRKVFEILGSKMKTEKSNDQLSGLGFSSTQKNSIFCKVRGSFSRNLNITF